MGETDEELVEVAFALRELGAESVPVNFLLPFEGTPLHSHRELTPQRCLRILSMMRLVHPDSELRSAAGREYHVRTLQPLVLEVCNSIFLGDYLTSEGQTGNDDLSMIRDAGFHIVDASDGDGGICFGRGNHERARQAVEEELDGLRAAQSHDRLDGDGVPIRLRGAGTARVPNV